jgi:hypothetical protein
VDTPGSPELGVTVGAALGAAAKAMIHVMAANATTTGEKCFDFMAFVFDRLFIKIACVTRAFCAA